MSYQVLSRKWRPKTFQDVVGQAHVTKSLQNSIIANRLGHAYVFTGTRGIGKTSVARIFSKSLRCLDRLDDANPCEKCKSCIEFDESASMNIQELDGASNNSVDDIRSLVGNVQTLPTYGEYKIYIIDEVHMLSVSAFNALLKTLEEPPEHVIFIMATTEPHKIPDTVLSRCQRFDFRNASTDLLEKHIKDIANIEGIDFLDNSLPRLIALQAAGSFRDSLSLLDQVLSFSSDNRISEDTVSLALGMAKTSSIKNLSLTILTENLPALISGYRDLIYANISLENISRSLLDSLYDVIQNIDDLEVINFSKDESDSLKELTIDELFWIYEGLCKDLSWAVESLSPEKSIEIVLQKYAMRSQLLGRSEQAPTIKKKTKITPPVVELKSWSDFEKSLISDLPAIATQLHHGNLASDPIISESSVHVAYGFSESSKLFYENLITEDRKEKIESLMKNFFKVQDVSIEFELIKEDKNFQSKADIIEKNLQLEKEDKLNNFKNHPIIKEAEVLFGTSVKNLWMKE